MDGLTTEDITPFVGCAIKYCYNKSQDWWKDSHLVGVHGTSAIIKDGEETIKISDISLILPVLRTIDQLTEEEESEWRGKMDEIEDITEEDGGEEALVQLICEMSLWLMRKGIDVLGWIEKDLAIKNQQ